MICAFLSGFAACLSLLFIRFEQPGIAAGLAAASGALLWWGGS